MNTKQRFSLFEKGYVGTAITAIFSGVFLMSIWALDSQALEKGKKEVYEEECQRMCQTENSTLQSIKRGSRHCLRVCQCENGSTFETIPRRIQNK